MRNAWRVGIWLACAASATGQGLRFEESFPATASAAPLDGRMLLLISKDAKTEPRYAITFMAGTREDRAPG